MENFSFVQNGKSKVRGQEIRGQKLEIRFCNTNERCNSGRKGEEFCRHVRWYTSVHKIKGERSRDQRSRGQRLDLVIPNSEVYCYTRWYTCVN